MSEERGRSLGLWKIGVMVTLWMAAMRLKWEVVFCMKGPTLVDASRSGVKRPGYPVHYWFSSQKFYATSKWEQDSYR